MQDKMPSHIHTCIEIALECVDANQEKRPTINEIVDKLDEIDLDSVQVFSPRSHWPVISFH
jgi:hypothetical protein